MKSQSIKDIYLPMLILIIAFAGCAKTLTETPNTFLDEGKTFSTEDGAVSATMGVYQSLRDNSYYGQFLMVYLILNSDEAVGRGSYVPAGNYQPDATNINRIGDIWTSIYASINRANVVIQQVPQVSVIERILKNQLVAEAKFIRALDYYNLVRLWGDVPMRLEPASGNFALARSPSNDVYDQIVNDLTDAEENLPDVYSSTDIGRATKWAAKALLADVYLTRENWDAAKQKATEVVESGKYSLVQVNSSLDFQNKIFGPDISTNSEDILSIKYSVQLNNDAFIRFFHRPESKYSDGGPYAILGNLNSFVGKGEWKSEQTADLRRNHSLYAGADDALLDASVPMLFRKFRGTPTNESNSTPLIRYPEVLLILAEAESQSANGPTPEAYKALNMVRRRAYGKDPNVPDLAIDYLSGLNKAQFKDTVLLERAKELVVEGKRWFDLLRTGTALDVLKPLGFSITEKNLKWPIAQEEIDNNDALTQADQNPDW